jgi:hypothetical protein
VIAGKKGEAGGEPKSRENGQRPPRDSWGTELLVRETDALRERGPCLVFCGGEELHAPVPKSPPTLDFTIALCVVPTGGGVLGTGGFQHSGEQSGEKLRRGIGVDYVR